MRSGLPSLVAAVGATFASWGVSEYNQLAGAFAFTAAGIYSVVKVAVLICDRFAKPKSEK